MLAEQFFDVHAHPLGIHVAVTARDALIDDGREATANGAFPLKVIDDFLDYSSHQGGFRRRRGGNAKPFGGELARFNTHGCAFDARAADVDTENFHIE